MSEEHASLLPAFTELFDRYAQPIFRHCFFRVRDEQLAEDILQETFVRTWEYLASGRKILHERAFLYRTATNVIIDEMRKQKRRPTVSLDEMMEAGQEPRQDVDAQPLGELDRDQLFALLDRLEEPYRELLILRYVDNCPPREIATIVGRSAAVVSVQLNRAVRKLRSLLPHG